ncbi:hypothetical protein BJV82DRAFT_587317 [Fennellomyces sp. T-0311]|nr:hypothetical protein BJV82DRAFT_587317 [Fennellomyces sp. T-0311]
MSASRALQPHQQTQEEEVPSFDSLAEKLTVVGDYLGTINEQMEELNQSNESLIRLNNAFGAFLFGLTSHSSSVKWAHLPDKGSLHHAAQGRVVKPGTSTSAPKKQGRRFTTKISLETILSELPRQFREDTDSINYMKKVLKTLRRQPDGYTLGNLAKTAEIPQHKATECLKELIHSKHVLKQALKGQLTMYQLNPNRYPSK